jgi:hypothetical protein
MTMTRICDFSFYPPVLLGEHFRPYNYVERAARFSTR